MSCKTFNLKSCEIQGATYQGRKIDFVNKVITQDVFTAKVYDTQGYLLTEIIGIKSGSVVYFPFTAIQNLSKDKYRIKYWADFYLLGTILLGEEELTIGNTCPNCEVDDSTIPFVLELGTETIDFTLQLVYIAIGNGSGEVDLSEYLKRVDADELYALKNHTHSYNDLTDLPPNQNIDSVVTIGAVTATTNNVNLALHFSGVNRVYIGGENYYKITEDNFSFTPVTTGIKVLLIYALPDSQIFYLAEGIESAQAVEPTGLPTNALLVARLIVSTTGTVVEESNTDFKLKLEDYWQNWYVTNPADKQILSTYDARGSFYITKSAIEPGSVTIGGLSKILPETEDATKIFYEGREFWIYNATGEPMLLNSTGVSPIDAFLISDKLTPFTVKNNHAVKVKLRGDILELLPSGGSGIETIAAGENATIDNSVPNRPIVTATFANGFVNFKLENGVLTIGGSGSGGEIVIPNVTIQFIDGELILTNIVGMNIDVVDGELIITNYQGASAMLVDGELILN